MNRHDVSRLREKLQLDFRIASLFNANERSRCRRDEAFIIKIESGPKFDPRTISEHREHRLAVLDDNSTAAVTNPDRYNPGINRTYAEMAGPLRHRDSARPRRPKDRAKVEVAVQIAQRWIPARLRNQRFISLAELNAAIRVLASNSAPARCAVSAPAEPNCSPKSVASGELPDRRFGSHTRPRRASPCCGRRRRSSRRPICPDCSSPR